MYVCLHQTQPTPKNKEQRVSPKATSYGTRQTRANLKEQRVASAAQQRARAKGVRKIEKKTSTGKLNI